MMYNVRIDCNESIVYYKLHYIYFWFDALCFGMKEEKKDLEGNAKKY